MTNDPSLKPVIWVGSSRKDLQACPEPVQDHVGYALYLAQRGGKHRDTKALSGFGGAGVVEIFKDFRGDAFRAVYTLRFAGAVYVLHAFQKNPRLAAKRRAGTSSWCSRACVRPNRLPNGGNNEQEGI
jgi:phage-related protein